MCFYFNRLLFLFLVFLCMVINLILLNLVLKNSLLYIKDTFALLLAIISPIVWIAILLVIPVVLLCILYMLGVNVSIEKYIDLFFNRLYWFIK